MCMCVFVYACVYVCMCVRVCVGGEGGEVVRRGRIKCVQGVYSEFHFRSNALLFRDGKFTVGKV